MRYLLYTIAFLTLAPAASAQSPGPASPQHDRGWVTVNRTAATANFGRTRALQVGYHVATAESVFPITVRAVNVGLGYSWVSRWSRLAGFVGPAISWGDPRNDFTTIGALANAQVIFTPVPELGIGVTLWGNLNPEQRVGGLGWVFVFEGNK